MQFGNGLLAAMALNIGLAATAFAAEHEVKMLNKGAAGTMVFEPSFVRAEPGDVIHFVPTDKSHDVQSIDKMLPEGVAPFKGEINKPYDLTVTEPGVYGIKCSPHFSMGMVGLIQVGDAPANLEAAKAVKLPKKAQGRMNTDFEQVK
ncbi:pseudoazurin [Paenirhodobacter sp.]|uniref:pseudoazurin n=1 Tax=Paenirhodobacter sp. TaxID=1965326 RepID=UPI003B3D50A6